MKQETIQKMILRMYQLWKNIKMLIFRVIFINNQELQVIFQSLPSFLNKHKKDNFRQLKMKVQNYIIVQNINKVQEL